MIEPKEDVRTEITYSRLTEENKSFLEKESKKLKYTVAALIDKIIEKYRLESRKGRE